MKKKLFAFLCILSMIFNLGVNVQAATAGSFANPYNMREARTVKLQNESYQDVVQFNIKLLDLYSGATANKMMADGSRYNTVPKSDEQWVIYKFQVKASTSNAKRTHLIELFENNSYSRMTAFATSNGKALKTLADRYPDCNYGSPLYEKTPLYNYLEPGEQKTVYVPVLVKKSVGIPLIKINTKAYKDAQYNTVNDTIYLKAGSSLPAAISVSLSNTSKTATEGVKFKLTAKVAPSTASQSVTWRVGNSAIASVDSAGNVTAKKAGSTYVYAKTANGKETKCLVKVVSPATSVSLSNTTKTATEGVKFKLTAKVTPSTALQSVTWRVGNSAIASVDSAGNVTAKKAGNTYVYAKTANGKEAKCLVKVVSPATGVNLSYTTKTMSKGTSFKFSATVTPSTALQSVTWRTGNATIATVDSTGKVTAKNVGNTYVYAKTANGKETKCLLRVQ